MQFDGIADLVKHLETETHWDRMRRSRSPSPNESLRTQNSIASMSKWLSASECASALDDLPLNHEVDIPIILHARSPPKSPSPGLDGDESVSALAETERILEAVEDAETSSPEPDSVEAEVQGYSEVITDASEISAHNSSTSIRSVWERCLTLEPEVRSRLFELMRGYPGRFDWTTELDSIIQRLKAIPNVAGQLKEVDDLNRELLRKYNEDRHRRLREIQHQRRMAQQYRYPAPGLAPVLAPFRGTGVSTNNRRMFSGIGSFHHQQVALLSPTAPNASASMPTPISVPAALVRMRMPPPAFSSMMPQNLGNRNPMLKMNMSNSNRTAFNVVNRPQLPFGIRAVSPVFSGPGRPSLRSAPASPATTYRPPNPVIGNSAGLIGHAVDARFRQLTHMARELAADLQPPAATQDSSGEIRQFRWEFFQAGLNMLRQRVGAQRAEMETVIGRWRRERMEMEMTMTRWQRENANLDELLNRLDASFRNERQRMNAENQIGGGESNGGANGSNKSQ